MKKQWGLVLILLLSASQGFSSMMPPSGLSKFAFDQNAVMMDLTINSSRPEYFKTLSGTSAKAFVTIVTYSGAERSFESFFRFTAEEIGKDEQSAHDRLKERLTANLGDFYGAQCLNGGVTVRVYSSNFTVEFLSAGSRVRGSPLGSLIGLQSDCHIQGIQKAEALMAHF